MIERTGIGPITRRSTDGTTALSAAQQRFWFFDQLAPGSPVYNRPTALRLHGPLDVTALETSLNLVIARHEVLRTVFGMDDGLPVQRVAASRPLHLEIVDLRPIDAADREIEVNRQALAGIARPMDLETGPLIRAQLLQLGDTDHVLVLTIHHIAMDGWSEGLLLQELAEGYAAHTSARAPELPSLPIQYADYAAWQEEQLRGDMLERQLEYWRTHLQGMRGILDLPTDRPRPRQREFRGARHTIRVPVDVRDAVQLMSRRNGVTLFMTLLAAWSVLLSRYTRDDDMVVGCPIAGRRRVELERLIGCFINMFPVRVDLTGDPGFEQLLRRVRDASLGAYANQDVPFQALLAEVRPERDPARSPLFQVMFNLRNLPAVKLSLPGIQVSDWTVETGTSLVDLSLEVEPDPNGLLATLEYDTDLFDSATAERMLSQFRTLLDDIIVDPSRRISDLSILSDAERNEVLRTASGETMPVPALTVRQMIGARAQSMPDAEAVTLNGNSLTYGHLDQRASHLADRLRLLGVGREVIVGLCLERSLHLPVSLLAVLEAGGAWLPLDPDLPEERFRFMIEDAGPSVILTESALRGRIPPLAGVEIVCVDLPDAPKDAQAGNAAGTGNATDAVRDGDAAYVIYTSGSTGRPKGVVITQAAFRNTVVALARDCRLGPGDRSVHFASISFDATVEELFPPWVQGGTVILRTDEWIASTSSFMRALERERVTTLNLPTSFWHEWVRGLTAGGQRFPESLRLVVVGGEKAAADALAAWMALTDDRIVWVNSYGPTETTVIATLWRPGPALSAADAADIPIGRPIANTSAYVLDARLRPVPIGVPGELWLGGAGVGRGYLNRPELTEERFQADPFSSIDGATMYRTGDLVRLRADGNIIFGGRIDRQIKLRGFRIEPGEIEVALRSHAAVSDALVIPYEHGEGDVRLVAYVVAPANAAPPPGVLRQHLQQQLPEYMVPALFVRLDSFPMGTTGKLDRAALPAPDPESAAAAGTGIAPRTPAEQRMARIWEELLGVPRVGVTDDFFELGGHSLLAVRMGARIEQEFGARVPMSALFESATVQHLVSRLDESGPTAPALVPVQPAGSRRPFFCVHEFFGDVLLFQRLARRLGDEQPFWGLQAMGVDGNAEPVSDIPAMAASYIAAMRTVQREGPYTLGGMCAGGLVALEMAQQLRASGEDVALLALLDSSAWSFVPANERPAHEHSILDFLRDVPQWLRGLADLTREQRRDVLRLKAGLWRERLTGDHGPATGPEGIASDRRIRAIGRVFRLSRHQRRVAHAFREALRAYRPQPYAGRMVLFRARMQPLFGSHDRTKGWHALAAGEFEVRTVHGNHLGMLQEPHVVVLAEALAAALGAG